MINCDEGDRISRLIISEKRRNDQEGGTKI